jgi:hypothetical protein
MEVKMMLVHMLIRYDFEPQVSGVRPKNNVFGLSVTLNMFVKIRFRKRPNLCAWVSAT